MSYGWKDTQDPGDPSGDRTLGERASGLGPAYAKAWEEWRASGEAEAWVSVVGDGLETPRE